jgi:nitrilase
MMTAMPSESTRFIIAAAQISPVFLDREATIEKACRIIREAGEKGARWIVFPEAFVPTYPFCAWFIPAGENRALRALYAELVANAVTVPSDATDRLCSAAREASISVAIGINELAPGRGGSTLYNSLLYIGSDGQVLGSHRKLIPTGGERLVHGQGNGSTLQSHNQDFGVVGGLICWENYMPLARYAMYAAGVQFYAAPTWDRGEPWISTLRHIAKEGRMYVVGCCSAIHRDEVPDRFEFKSLLPAHLEWINPGDTAIVDPDGKFLVEPVRNRQEVIYAEVDRTMLSGTRGQLDVVGHYARPDVFRLIVNRNSRPVIEDDGD